MQNGLFSSQEFSKLKFRKSKMQPAIPARTVSQCGKVLKSANPVCRKERSRGNGRILDPRASEDPPKQKSAQSTGNWSVSLYRVGTAAWGQWESGKEEQNWKRHLGAWHKELAAKECHHSTEKKRSFAVNDMPTPKTIAWKKIKS